jgi:hypothetical protein
MEVGVELLEACVSLKPTTVVAGETVVDMVAADRYNPNKSGQSYIIVLIVSKQTCIAGACAL